MKRAVRITAIIQRDQVPAITRALARAGFARVQTEAGRAPVLQEKRTLFGLLSTRTVLENDPVEVLTLLVEPEEEKLAVAIINSIARLETPGLGSVFSQDVQVVRAHQACTVQTASHPEGGPSAKIESGKNRAKSDNDGRVRYPEPEQMFRYLSGITCIVQRGQGDVIARMVLESGAGVPWITYGDGAGVRDKLGLLRVTIPAAKDVVSVVVSSYDVDQVMELMIEAGKLDQPGRGFINIFPVKQGVINTRSRRGDPAGYAASMEQIIAALDNLKGGMEWRRRSIVSGAGRNSERIFLRGMTEFNLTCDEGRGAGLVRAAMDAGAGGATILKVRSISLQEQDRRAGRDHHHHEDEVSPARELCTMCIPESKLEELLSALEAEGGFEEDAHGIVTIGPAPRAFTYVAQPAG